jgi:hypothetical protein
LINNGLDDCGVGHKERYPICKNHFGQIVEAELCEEVCRHFCFLYFSQLKRYYIKEKYIGDVGLTGLTLSHGCSRHKPEHGFPLVYVRVFDI